jgi:hypothetical protein
MDGALLLEVDEHVEDDEDEVFVDDVGMLVVVIMEEDEEASVDVDGVVWVALTTIVFGAFPLITFTFTTFTTVVDEEDGICEISMLLLVVMAVELVMVEGIDGTFLVGFGEV